MSNKSLTKTAAELLRKLIRLHPRFRFGAAGKFHGFAIPLKFSRQSLTHLLPGQELELVPNREPNHPVILLIGNQKEVCFRREEEAQRSFSSYTEAVFAIPNVQFRRDQYAYNGPFVYAPALYLDSNVPIGLGWLCGYNKRMCRFDTKFDSNNRPVYRGFVSDESGDPAKDHDLFSVAYNSIGDWDEYGKFPYFRKVHKLLSQPILGAFHLHGACAHVCTRLEFDWSAARLRSIEGDVKLTEWFLPALDNTPKKFPGLDQDEWGAFAFDAPWVLTPPTLPHYYRHESLYKPGSAPAGLSDLEEQTRLVRGALEIPAGVLHGLGDGLTGLKQTDQGVAEGLASGMSRFLRQMSEAFHKASVELASDGGPDGQDDSCDSIYGTTDDPNVESKEWSKKGSAESRIRFDDDLRKDRCE